MEDHKDPIRAVWRLMATARHHSDPAGQGGPADRGRPGPADREDEGMPLKIVRRPDTGTFQITGTIRVGKASVRVRESAGTADRAVAEELARRRQREIEDDLLTGGQASVPSFASAVERYASSRHLHRNDRNSPSQAARIISGRTRQITSIVEVGTTFRAQHLAGRTPATLARWRTTLVSVLHHAGLAPRYPCPPGRRWQVQARSPPGPIFDRSRTRPSG